MAETYCGKSCSECTQKEYLNCPGCKVGPGRQLGGPCELARCIRSKGHESCESCSFKGNCGTLRGREGMADYWRRKKDAEEQRQAAIAAKAPILGKWLWISFWLVIPSSVVGVLTNQNVAAAVPGLGVAGQILKAALCAAYGVILLRLVCVEQRYRTAGICFLISGGASLALALVSGTETVAWTLLISIPALAVSMVGEYHEYSANNSVLLGVDEDLAEKWALLWQWYLVAYVALVGSILLVFILPVLGALVLLAAAIGLVVISIKKLIYLYRTAKLFREYPV